MKKKKTTPTTKPDAFNVLPLFPTMQTCSTRTGIPISILKSAKRAGSPGFDTGGRVNVAEFLAWYFTHGQTIDAIPFGCRSWREVLSRAESKRVELRLQKERGQVLDMDEARGYAVEAVNAFFDQLDRYERELPPQLKGLDEAAIFKVLHAEKESIRGALAAKFNRVGKEESL